MIEQTIAIGLIASLLTEAFKLFPFLSVTDTRKRITAFAIAIILSVLYLSTQLVTWSGLFTFCISAIGMSFAIYKLVLKPVETKVFALFKKA
jgi:hypothetical protein